MKRLIESKMLALLALLFSLCFMVVGSNLLNSLLSLRANLEGISVEAIGLMGTLFFLGYILGCLFIPRLVHSVGHIRAFAGLASISSSVALAYLFWISAVSWCVLRACSGFCYAGMIIIVEGWLSGTATKLNRGKLLAVYSIVFTSAWALSQQMLNLSEISGHTLFMLAGIFLSTALVPITLSRTVEPGPVEATRESLGNLYDLSPMGLAGSFTAGLCASSFISLGPVYAISLGYETEWVSLFMSITIVGALLLHWPIGWLSDRHDRRKIIIITSSVSSMVSFLLAFQGGTHVTYLMFLAFAFGASTFSLYVLSVAHISDLIDESKTIPVISQLIIVYGIGAIVGPIMAGIIMGRIGPEGLYVFLGAFKAAFVAYCLYRLPMRAPTPEEEKRSFIVLPRTTHAILQLMRRPESWFRKRKRQG